MLIKNSSLRCFYTPTERLFSQFARLLRLIGDKSRYQRLAIDQAGEWELSPKIGGSRRYLISPRRDLNTLLETGRRLNSCAFECIESVWNSSESCIWRCRSAIHIVTICHCASLNLSRFIGWIDDLYRTDHHCHSNSPQLSSILLQINLITDSSSRSSRLLLDHG